MKPEKSIAFIYYPRSVDRALLGSMPFALNSVRTLSNTGRNIDLYLWEKDISVYENIFTENVNLLTLNSCKPYRLIKLKQLQWLNYLNNLFIRFEVLRKKDYYCVFGTGQIGAYLASLFSSKNHCPFIYLNDEFPSSFNTSPGDYWHVKERIAAENATKIIVPDPHRAAPLCRELLIKYDEKKFSILPNSILIQAPVLNINWHERLGLPEKSIPFIHAGSVADWAQIPEILSSVPYWPQEAVLILHDRIKISEHYREQLSHLFVKDRVFWSQKPLPENELNSLIAYCAGSFSLYRDQGDNIKHIGWSSGKLLRSLICGKPVIASRIPSLSFVEEQKLGCLVTHPCEIPDAIKTLILNNSEYANNCLEYGKNVISFERWWLKFRDDLEESADIKL